MGVDCSGLTQLYGRLIGINLPRDAWQQESAVEPLNAEATCERGDLLFFAEPEGKISHVGIYIGEDKILHASGRVRIDLLTKKESFTDRPANLHITFTLQEKYQNTKAPG